MQWIILHEEDVTMTYRYHSMLSTQTDFAGNLDVQKSCDGAISASLAGCNCNTSTGVINNQTENIESREQIILINCYSQHIDIIYVIELDYKKVRICISRYKMTVLLHIIVINLQSTQSSIEYFYGYDITGILPVCIFL